MLTVYISHPFTGNEEKNRKLARKISADLCKKAKEYNSAIAIINPCDCIRYAEKAELPYEECIQICLKLIEKCDALLLASGWEKSRGCVTEAAYAVHLNIPVSVLPENTVNIPKNVTVLNNQEPFISLLKTQVKTLCIKDIPLKNKDFLKKF